VLEAGAAGAGGATSPDDAAGAGGLAGDIRPCTFVHPGLLNTQEELDELARRALGDDAADPVAIAWQALLATKEASLDYVSHPDVHVHVAGGVTTPTEADVKSDARAAYAHALAWALSGDPAHAALAISILDAWASTLKVVDLDARTKDKAQIALESAWIAPMFAGAADIVRYYRHAGARAGWAPAEVAAFTRFLRYLAYNAGLVVDRRDNWGASAALALMSAGVFSDDPALYARGLDAWKPVLEGTIHSDGVPDELPRRNDCEHPQYSLLALAQAAEIAWHQSTDLYSYRLADEDESRLLLGVEFMSYLFTGGADFTGWSGDALDCPSVALPGYEVPYNHYRYRLGREPSGGCVSNRCCGAEAECDKGIAAFDRFVQSQRPDGTAVFFLGWSTLTHGDLSRP
jgi:hypothetical protein